MKRLLLGGMVALTFLGTTAFSKEKKVKITGKDFYSFVEPYKHWKSSPAWYRFKEKKYWSEAIKPFKYEGLRERLKMPPSVKWIDLSKKEWQDRIYSVSLKMDEPLPGGKLPDSITLSVGLKGITTFDLIHKKDPFNGERPIAIDYLLTPYPRGYEKVTHGLIKKIYVTKGMKNVLATPPKDTTIYFRGLGDVKVKKLNLIITYDTLNPGTYVNSPLGMIYSLDWHTLSPRQLKNEVWGNLFTDAFYQFILFSGYVEACAHYNQAVEALRKEKEEYEEIVRHSGQVGREIIDLKKFQRISLVFNPDSCSKYLDYDGKSSLLWGTRGGAVVVIGNIDYVAYDESAVRAWNSLKFWDEEGFPLHPRKVESNDAFGIWMWLGGRYSVGALMSSSMEDKDTITLFFMPKRSVWNDVEEDRIPHPPIS